MSQEKSKKDKNVDISLISNTQLSFKTGAFTTIATAFLLTTTLLAVDAYFFPKKREYESSRVIENINPNISNEIPLLDSTLLKNYSNLENIIELPLYFNFLEAKDLNEGKSKDISDLLNNTTQLVAYLPNNSLEEKTKGLTVKEKDKLTKNNVNSINSIYELGGLIYYVLPLELSSQPFNIQDLKNNPDFQIFKKAYESPNLSSQAIKGVLLSNYNEEINPLEKKNKYAEIYAYITDNFGFTGDVKFGFKSKNFKIAGEDLVNTHTILVDCYSRK